MQITEPSKPWYKYPLVWMMLAIPFSAVIMGVIMMWLAVDTDDGLVADDYYKLGMEINRVLSRDKKAAELGLSAIIEFDNSTRIIRVQFDKGALEKYPNSLPLALQHATRENSDITVLLDHGIGDQYIGHVSQSISEGIWYFEIADKSRTDADWKLNARHHVRKKNTIHLKSNE
jgi:uncharacterized protein